MFGPPFKTVNHLTSIPVCMWKICSWRNPTSQQLLLLHCLHHLCHIQIIAFWDGACCLSYLISSAHIKRKSLEKSNTAYGGRIFESWPEGSFVLYEGTKRHTQETHFNAWAVWVNLWEDISHNRRQAPRQSHVCITGTSTSTRQIMFLHCLYRLKFTSWAFLFTCNRSVSVKVTSKLLLCATFWMCCTLAGRVVIIGLTVRVCVWVFASAVWGTKNIGWVFANVPLKLPKTFV